MTVLISTEPFDRVYDAVTTALHEMGAEVDFVAQPKNVVVAKTGPSFKSWGETISVELIRSKETTVVHVDSASSVSITLIDWGKNRENEL